MKISSVETILLTIPSRWLWGSRPRNLAFLRVSTDSGLTGLGESLLAYWVPELVAPLVGHFREILLGKNPFEINKLWGEMHVKAMRWGHVGAAISVLGGLEIALWDLVGKALGVPLYQLFGGAVRARLRCYASTGSPMLPLAKSVEHFKGLVDRGFTALKTVHGYINAPEPVGVASLVGQEREKFATLRRELGNDVDLMLDPAAPYNREPWSGDTALRVVRALDEYDLLWIEQPVVQTNVDEYARIRELCSTPLAAGENGTTLHDFKPFFEKRAIDIVQPDATWSGGLSECFRIIAAAEAHDMRAAPHCFSGAVGLAANYHVALASRACFIVEAPVAVDPITEKMLGEAFRFEDGYLYPTGAPGLGLSLPETLVEQYPFVPGSGLSHARSPFPRPVPPGWKPGGEGSLAW